MNAAGVSRAFPAAVLVAALALAGAAGLVLFALDIASQDVPPAMRLLAAIAAPALLAPLFGGRAPATLAAVTARFASWALGTLLLVIVVALAGGALPLAGIAAPLLVAGGIVVTALLAMLVVARALRSIGMDAAAAESSAGWMVVAALWLLAAAPLWLGPFADLAARTGPARANAIVASSPLVHLGVAAGQDLLRTQWFYQHAGFGTLQFDYPSPASLVCAYLGASAVLTALAFAMTRHPTRPRNVVPEPLPTQESAR